MFWSHHTLCCWQPLTPFLILSHPLLLPDSYPCSKPISLSVVASFLPLFWSHLNLCCCQPPTPILIPSHSLLLPASYPWSDPISLSVVVYLLPLVWFRLTLCCCQPPTPVPIPSHSLLLPASYPYSDPISLHVVYFHSANNNKHYRTYSDQTSTVDALPSTSSVLFLPHTPCMSGKFFISTLRFYSIKGHNVKTAQTGICIKRRTSTIYTSKQRALYCKIFK